MKPTFHFGLSRLDRKRWPDSLRELGRLLFRGQHDFCTYPWRQPVFGGGIYWYDGPIWFVAAGWLGWSVREPDPR